MGSSKSKNKKKKGSKSGKSESGEAGDAKPKEAKSKDAKAKEPKEVKPKEIKPPLEPPPKHREWERQCQEPPCDTSRYFNLEVELLVSFNKCFTGFLAEIPSTSLRPSSHDELCERITNGDNYKYLMSCPFRDNQMNTCMQDFCCRKAPITVSQQCPLDC